MAGPAIAEPFAENFDVMGTLTLIAQGQETTSFIPYDRTRQRPFVKSQKTARGRSVSITAASPTETGAPGRPMTQLQIAFSSDETPVQIFVRYSDEQGASRPLLSNPTLGQSVVTEYETFDDGMVRIGFSATLVRVDVSQSMSDPVVVEGEPNLEVRGMVEFYYDVPTQ